MYNYYVKLADARLAIMDYIGEQTDCKLVRDGAEGAMNALDYLTPADVVPKSEVEELICKLECLLCHVTGGRLSKHTYDLATMEAVATDCINETYNDGYGEGYKDCATEIFKELETKAPWFCENQTAYEHFNEELAELKKKYQEGE